MNEVSPFNLSPWGADLHDDVINVSGRGRDYLLTAWYEHVFELDHDNSVDLTLGIIDASTIKHQNNFDHEHQHEAKEDKLSRW